MSAVPSPCWQLRHRRRQLTGGLSRAPRAGVEPSHVAGSLLRPCPEAGRALAVLNKRGCRMGKDDGRARSSNWTYPLCLSLGTGNVRTDTRSRVPSVETCWRRYDHLDPVLAVWKRSPPRMALAGEDQGEGEAIRAWYSSAQHCREPRRLCLSTCLQVPR